MNQILHSVIIGKGTPLIIAHGFLGMSDNWKSIGRVLSEKGFEVHLLDMRNHGKSFHSTEFSYDIMSQDIANYIQYYQIEATHIIGHSMGGKVAMLFSTLFPKRTKSVTIVDTSPKHYDPHHSHILNALKTTANQQPTNRKQADQLLSQTISELGLRQFLLKNFELKNGILELKINIDTLIDKQNYIGEPLYENNIYQGKTLFIKGENSDYIDNHDKPLLYKHFPKYTLKVFPKCGHWLHAEAPELFVETFLSFICET